MEDLKAYDFEGISDVSFTNFVYKLNYLPEEDMQLILKNASFQRRQLTVDHVSCLRYFSNTGSMRLTSNLLRVLDTEKQKHKVKALLSRYDDVDEIDQPMYWNTDLT